MQSLPSTLRRALRARLPLLLAAVLASSTVTPAPAVATSPADLWRILEVTREPGGEAPVGWDISYPQCGGPFPVDPDFAIVGVNGGRAFTVNPCLGAGNAPSQLAWAGRYAELYINTGNPGPELSKAPWPSGQLWPRFCNPKQPDSVACAYDYGWNGAAHSYRTAVKAYVSLGWAEPDARRTPVANFWWLDVETGNSWREDPELNVAALQGAVDYLETMDVGGIGFYSIGGMWQEVTGGTDAFGEYPNWVAGATTVNGARKACIGPGFTGGVVLMGQYLRDGFDANHRC